MIKSITLFIIGILIAYAASYGNVTLGQWLIIIGGVILMFISSFLMVLEVIKLSKAIGLKKSEKSSFHHKNVP